MAGSFKRKILLHHSTASASSGARMAGKAVRVVVQVGRCARRRKRAFCLGRSSCQKPGQALFVTDVNSAGDVGMGFSGTGIVPYKDCCLFHASMRSDLWMRTHDCDLT